MKKRILSFCLAVGMLTGIAPAGILAEEAELKFVSCYGEGLQEGAGTSWANLFDKDEESVALINTSISDTITLKPEGEYKKHNRKLRRKYCQNRSSIRIKRSFMGRGRD